jgi:hypothetical protein
VKKSDREIMEILEAFDALGSRGDCNTCLLKGCCDGCSEGSSAAAC